MRRIVYSLARLEGKSVVAMPRVEWNTLVEHNGDPTLLSDAPTPLQGVQQDAFVVAIAASGVKNPDPGIDVVRRDEADAPKVYNVDHYRVIEDLHARLAEVLPTAGVADSPGLRDYLRNTVFIVGPYDKGQPNHWLEHLPEFVLGSKPKSDGSSPS